jgi:hypothetical protein
MLVGQLMISIFVAIAVAVTAAVTGHGVLGVLLYYSLSGSLTLLLLAGWAVFRRRSDDDRSSGQST